MEREQIDEFVAVLDFLQVWEWRLDYGPEECGYEGEDGGEWSFTALIDSRACRAGGVNAFPSFADVKHASLNVERYGLVVAAIRGIFRIDMPLKLVR